jgi:hypothetical protein
VQQWSLGLQREFADHWTAELDYVGTKSTHLDLIYDYNQPFVVSNISTGKIPYPNFGYIEYTTPVGYGNYNGLQGSVARKATRGLSLRASFTYSRSLDDTPEELETSSGGAPNGRNLSAWYGPSDFNIPLRISGNSIYELPFGPDKPMLHHGPLSWVFRGFRASGVYTFYSGIPYQVNAGSALSNSLDPNGAATGVPNVIGKPHTVGKVDCWFYASQNQACRTKEPHLMDSYSIPAPGSIGDLGRNTMRGPHTSVFDAALLREVPIGRANLEFRWEIFNVANTPIFGPPNNDFSSGVAGQITSLSGDQRTMQFALRLSY